MSKNKKARVKREDEATPAKAPVVSDGPEAGSPTKMARKEYEREMARLQEELVALQEWVRAPGAKICVVFEGHDTAGKGGTIKRISERVQDTTDAFHATS